MVFNSIHYAIFFVLVTILYFLFPSKNRWKILLTASVYFYATFENRFFILLAFSIVSSYYFAIESNKTLNESRKKMFLHLTVWSNLLVICVFKYFNFFIPSIAASLSDIGLNFPSTFFKFAIPIGISFYTFQIIGYALDVHYGTTEPERNLGKYSLYMLFFPKMVAGPIEQSNNLLAQINKEHHFDYDRVTSGIKLFAWGLFKKVCIADRLYYFGSQVIENPSENTGLKAIVGFYFLFIQMYADFSGYTDMAVGASRIFGYDLVKNFNRPMISQSVTEFWKRYHMSLYHWFIEYIYNPLSFYLRGWKKYGIIASILITFTLSGLWHGATMPFVIYGLCQAIAIIIEYVTVPFREKLKQKMSPLLYKYVAIFITFHFVLFSEIFFYTDSISEAFNFVKSFSLVEKSQFGFYLFAEKSLEFKLAFVSIAILVLAEYWQGKTDNYLSFHKSWPAPVRWAVYSIFIIVIVFFAILRTSEFEYAQF